VRFTEPLCPSLGGTEQLGWNSLASSLREWCENGSGRGSNGVVWRASDLELGTASAVASDLELGTASAGVGLGVGNGVGWRGTWSWERRRLAWDLELWRGTWSRDEAEERGGHQRATKHSRLTARGEDRSCVTFVPPTLRSWLVAIVLGPASADLSSFALPRRNQPQHAHSCGVGLGVGDVGSSPGRHQKKDSEERRAEHPVMLAHDDEASHRWVVVVRAREPSRACKSLRARVDVCFTDD
jgi:hypothetical protein